ncbi:hypothetical protein I316_06108 [Kwoniella heveanensis BCC8398]|uniref:Uncharacterized protein n=1 Tax=Kwoniella heveanensis BCC8398 TaxID=1296120 RepID=A0A1B9GM74_9TREE|nr:hypothetical protein I316_06108 [Kwoniella heveanensis BCC8398]
MTTLRASAFAVAIPGPGPQTWLHRLSLASNRWPPTASPGISRALHDTRPLDRVKRTQRTNPPWYEPPTSTKRTPRLPSKSGPLPLQATTHIGEDVILLRVPPDYPIDEPLGKLRSALGSKSFDTALSTWSHLNDLGCIRRIPEEDFELASVFIKSVLVSAPYIHLGRLAMSQPLKFGIFRQMAIESAARGHFSGLEMFMLKLIEVGRPKDAVDTFTVCKDRMREIQAKEAKDLVSWDREKRLAARLEGKGLKHLMMVNVVALTLLDACDEHALFKMLDSSTDLRPSAYYDFSLIRRSLRKLPQGDTLYDKFRENVDRLILSVMCFHPDALVSRVNLLGTSRSSTKLPHLYERILRGSIGPNAFIRPRDLNDFGAVYINIPLPPIVWLTFMKVFEWRLDVDRIARMIDHDLPERGLEPNAHFLSAAMLHMTAISERSSISSHIRSKAKGWADEYWRRLTSNGWHAEDGAFSRRIRMLGIISWREGNLRGEIRRLYDAAAAGHLGRIGPKTRAAFVEYFMVNKQLDRAFRVFKSFPYDPNREDEDFDKAFSAFIRRLSLGHWTGQEKLKMCARALRMYAETGHQIRTHTLGPLLAIQLQGGLPMEKTIDAILQATVSPTNPQPGIQRWTKVLYGMLSKWTHHHSCSPLELIAGISILRRASNLDKPLFGATRLRNVGMWLSFLRPAARNDKISSAERQKLISEALDLFPGGKQEVSVNMWMEVIHSLISNREIDGFGEAWRRWNEVLETRPVPAVWWDKMLSSLLEHNKPEFALDVVKAAWEGGVPNRTEGFWLRAQSAGLARKLGIHAELEEEQETTIKRRPDASHQYGHVAGPEQGHRLEEGSTRRTEPLSLARDLDSDPLMIDSEMDQTSASAGKGIEDIESSDGAENDLSEDEDGRDVDGEDAEGRWDIVEEDEEEAMLDRHRG